MYWSFFKSLNVFTPTLESLVEARAIGDNLMKHRRGGRERRGRGECNERNENRISDMEKGGEGFRKENRKKRKNVLKPRRFFSYHSKYRSTGRH